MFNMDPTKYANIGDLPRGRPAEESAPLLDIDSNSISAPRMSEDTNPFVDDPLASEMDDGSSKESRQGEEERLTESSATAVAAPSHPIYMDVEGQPLPPAQYDSGQHIRPT